MSKKYEFQRSIIDVHCYNFQRLNLFEILEMRRPLITALADGGVELNTLRTQLGSRLYGGLAKFRRGGGLVLSVRRGALDFSEEALHVGVGLRCKMS